MRAAIFLVLLGMLGQARAGGLVGGAAAGEVVLVGAAGERYLRDGSGVWRQVAGGGTSATLTQVRAGAGVTLWGGGMTGPPFLHDGTTWSAVPVPSKGALVLGAGPAVGIAIGKRVFVRAGKAWQQIGALRQAPRQLWVGGAKEAVAATADGLWAWNGTAWRPVKGPTGVSLLAGERAPVFAAAGEGVFAVTPKNAKARLVAPGKRLLAASGTGRVLVVGDQVCETLQKCSPGPAIAPGDAVVAVVGEGDGLVVATRRGSVFVRRGGAWVAEKLDETPASASAPVANPPAKMP